MLDEEHLEKKSESSDSYVPNFETNSKNQEEMDPWTRDLGVKDLLEPEHKEPLFPTGPVKAETPIQPQQEIDAPIIPRRSERNRHIYQPYSSQQGRPPVIVWQGQENPNKPAAGPKIGESSGKVLNRARGTPGPVAGKNWVTQNMVRYNPKLANRNRHHREGEAYRATTKFLKAVKEGRIWLDSKNLRLVEQIFAHFLENFAKNSEDIRNM